MGQHQSKAAPQSHPEEIKYLAEHTKLSEKKLEQLFVRYSQKKKLTQKDFLKEFKQTFPNVVDPNPIAKRVFEACDTNSDGTISFREYILAVTIFTKAPQAVKMKHVFGVLDEDKSGTLSTQEVIKCVKQTYDILGKLNTDYNRRGIEVFRQMDKDGDMKISETEFVDACLADPELAELLQTSVGAEVLTGSTDSDAKSGK
eukprot:maker-scaffold941_size78300-snap-gene-0.15 protein:Tk00811 transcript:maker-scaffold941_size78300-snap-gene-0.15-mRNA-1 annotation:"conserved hypothetical protein"